MIRRPPRSTLSSSSAASDVYKRQGLTQLHAILAGLRYREAHLGTRVLRQALHRGLPRRADSVGDARGTSRRVEVDRRGTGGRAPRALPSRLSQPQPDAEPGSVVHHRLPGCAPRAGYLRPGLAPARLVRGFHRGNDRRVDGVLPGAEGTGRCALGRKRVPLLPGGFPASVRPDVAPAQSQGAWDVRLPDDEPAEPRLYPVPVSYTHLRAHE